MSKYEEIERAIEKSLEASKRAAEYAEKAKRQARTAEGAGWISLFFLLITLVAVISVFFH